MHQEEIMRNPLKFIILKKSKNIILRAFTCKILNVYLSNCLSESLTRDKWHCITSQILLQDADASICPNCVYSRENKSAKIEESAITFTHACKNSHEQRIRKINLQLAFTGELDECCIFISKVKKLYEFCHQLCLYHYSA